MTLSLQTSFFALGLCSFLLTSGLAVWVTLLAVGCCALVSLMLRHIYATSFWFVECFLLLNEKLCQMFLQYLLLAWDFLLVWLINWIDLLYFLVSLVVHPSLHVMGCGSETGDLANSRMEYWFSHMRGTLHSAIGSPHWAGFQKDHTLCSSIWI